MVSDADLTGEHGEVADRNAARYADLRDNQAMAADRAVVSDLHEIVDLGAFADHRIAGSAAVDSSVRTDLDVVLDDDAPGLRDFLVTLRRRQIAEAVLPDADTRMDDDPVADQGMHDRGAWTDCAVAADADARSNDRASADHRASAIFCGWCDHREGI